MTSIDTIIGGANDGGGGDTRSIIDHAHVVEMVQSSPEFSAADSVSNDQITPLLAPSEIPKINIFSVSHSRRKPIRDQATNLLEAEASPFTQFLLWAWNGSRYSGLICMALSSTIYCAMEVISDKCSVQAIPLFEVAFIRSTVALILSLIWLRKRGQPIFGPANVGNLLISRSLTGYLSLLSFIYCIKRLPLSQAILLSFTTPIMASTAARIILHERLKIAEIGGLACSFFGVLFIFRPTVMTQGWLGKTAEVNDSYIEGNHHIYAVLVGLFSSLTGGISYCLIRAASKASDQPVVTVFSFGALASPASLLGLLIFEEPLLPSLYSCILMVVLGVLAFFAEVLLARGLQLEKTSKVTNILYIEAAISQIWGMSISQVAPSFGRIVGCLLIFISIGCTMYIGPEKETE
ncbi:uncharacterized protein LOC124946153 [Impatiens glandulifera]|uniref:uncharacterized protein LOC124946153 n=1 Tax=Impatiens glandulifera TaxID=253017 RepID=UPI001FB1402B|nr:uncharacterized protein LOC124946153 [Impatiens glandulifera]